MARRTVRVGIFTFTDGSFATLGQEVDVADDQIERFDLLNGHEPEDEIEDAEVVEIEAPSAKWNKTKIAEFAEKWNIDISGASTKGEQLAAITAEIERRTAEADATGVLTDGSESEQGN